MNAVVTGGTGFIGGRLVQRLVEKGHKVRCLVRSTSDVESLKRLGVELFNGDLSETDSLEELVHGGEIVFHIAAMVSDWGSREDFYRMNVESTSTLLKASKQSGVKKFIYMSSSTVIWKSDLWEIHNLNDVDENYPYPRKCNDYYNETKAEAERIVLRFYKETGLETIVFRPSNVWGAGDRVILPRIVKAARKGILFPIGSGERWVSPCHVYNLVHALLLSTEIENRGGNIYFINDGIKIEHIEFVASVLKAIGMDWSPRFSLPYMPVYITASLMEFVFKFVGSKNPPVLTRFAVAALAGSRSYSIEKAKKELGYKPIIALEQGLDELRSWVQSIGGVEGLLTE